MQDETAERLDMLERTLGELVRRVEELESPLAPARPSQPAARRVAPTRPAEPPPPERVSGPPARTLDLEELLGGRVLGWVGGSAIVLGAVFFLVMAVSRGWIDEPTRVLLAFVGSTVLVGGGLYLYERQGQTQAALAAVASGIAALYASDTTATQLYDLIEPALGLGVAVVIGAAATAIAVRWNSRVVAGIGIVGALLAPFSSTPGRPPWRSLSWRSRSSRPPACCCGGDGTGSPPPRSSSARRSSATGSTRRTTSTWAARSSFSHCSG
jgi:uncharacterized membrane protein